MNAKSSSLRVTRNTHLPKQLVEVLLSETGKAKTVFERSGGSDHARRTSVSVPKGGGRRSVVLQVHASTHTTVPEDAHGPKPLSATAYGDLIDLTGDNAMPAEPGGNIALLSSGTVHIPDGFGLSKEVFQESASGDRSVAVTLRAASNCDLRNFFAGSREGPTQSLPESHALPIRERTRFVPTHPQRHTLPL
jgi:hypothetical protein